MKSIKQNPQNVKSTPNRVALYSRVSTQEQAQEGVSLSEQFERLNLLAKLEDWQVYDHYQDEGVSGGTDNRPHLQRLMADARAGRIDLVAVCKLDRFFRNTRLLLNFLHDLEGYGVGFTAQAEGIDTRKPGIGKITISLLGSIAEWERDRIGQRVSDFRNHLAGKGRWSSGRTTFGYRFNRETKELDICQIEADAIAFAFRHYVSDNLGLIRLAELMNTENLTTPRMGRRKHTTWTQSAVRHILTHPAYRGGPNELWQFKCPAIVDEEIWQAAQRQLSSNYHFRAASNPSPYQGLLRCGICGHTLRVGYSHNTKRVWECPGRLKRNHLDGSERCTLPRFEAQQLEDTLSQQICDMLSTPEKFIEQIEASIHRLHLERDELYARLKPLNDEEGELHESMSVLDARLEMHRISADQYRERMRGIQGKLKQLERRKSDADPLLVGKIQYIESDIEACFETLESLKEANNEEHRQAEINGLLDDLHNMVDEDREAVSFGLFGFHNWPDFLKNHKMTFFLYPDHTEIKGNIRQSVVTPGYR